MWVDARAPFVETRAVRACGVKRRVTGIRRRVPFIGLPTKAFVDEVCGEKFA